MMVSGDGDFIHLVNSLRPYGKFVAIAALSWTASPRLTESADWVRYYDLDVEPSAQQEPKTSQAKSEVAAISDEVKKVFMGIREIVSEHGRPLVLAALKPQLIQKLGNVDERRFGHTKFKPLVMEAQNAGYVRIVTEGLVDWVMPVDSDFESVDEVTERSDPENEMDALSGSGDGGMRLDKVPDELRLEIVGFSEGLESRSRYVTFTYLVQNLAQQPWMHLDKDTLKATINSAIEVGLFKRESFEDFDEYTGTYRRLPVLRLDRTHALVEEALGSVGN